MKEPPPRVKRAIRKAVLNFFRRSNEEHRKRTESPEITDPKTPPSATPKSKTQTNPQNTHKRRAATPAWNIGAMLLSMNADGYADSSCGKFWVTASGQSPSGYHFFIDQDWSGGPHPPEEFIVKAKSQIEANKKAIRWMRLFST